MHQFAGVPRVGLQQNRLLMAAAANAGTIIKLALASITRIVHRRIAGQRLTESVVVRRHIPLLRAGNSEYQTFMARKQRFLHAGNT